MSTPELESPPTVCPYCGQSIGRAELTRIKNHEAQQRQELTRLLEADFTAKTAEAEAARRAAQEEAAQLRRDLPVKVQEEVSVKTAELEASVERLRTDFDARLDERAADERRVVQDEFRKDIVEKEKQLESMSKTIEELKRKSEGKSAWRLGMQQDELASLLQTEFPKDWVRRVPGRSGADVIHDVQQAGSSCGTIVYESKNAQAWSNEWITKLHRDKTECGASIGVLVSIAFPANRQDLCIIDGIAVVHPRLITALVHVLRKSLVDLKLQELSLEDRGEKLEKLTLYLGSPEFRNRMQSVSRAVDKLDDLQRKERTAHDKTWREQEAQHRAIRGGTDDVDAEIREILSGR